MSATVAKLNVHVGADVTALQAGFAKGEAHINGFAGRIGSLGGLLSGALAGGGLVGGAGWALKLAADAEQAQVAFEVMLGSAERAKAMLAELRAFANVSPFSFTDVREQAQLLLNYGVTAENILPTIRTLADVASGNADKFKGLATAYGQISSTGRLMGQDLLQLINAGFNPLQEISKQTGESIVQLKKRMEAGNVSFAEVQQAFVAATSAGGRFFDMTARQSATLAGRWSSLVDAATELANRFGTELAPAAGRLIDLGMELIAWSQTLDPTLAGNVGRITAVAAAFTAAVLVIPRVISAVSAAITIFRQLATAQAIATAMSGPQGWLVVAGGIAAAAAATYALNQQFGEADKQITAAASSADKAATAVNAVAAAPKIDAFGEKLKKAFDPVKAANDELDKMRTKAEQLTESLKTPGEKLKDDFREAAELFQAGMIDPETFERAAAKFQEEFAKAKEDVDQLERKTVGANDRSTAAAFSAVQEAYRSRDDINDHNKRAEQQRNEQINVLKDILSAVRAEDGPSFKVADI